MKKLFCVYLESLPYYETLLKRFEKDTRMAQLFNTDLSHAQQYLFTKLKTEPTSKVEVEYDKNESRLIKLTKIKDNYEMAVALPPFSFLYFEIRTPSSLYNFDAADANDPITEIRARYQEEPEISFEGSEDSIIKDFSEYVLAKDPDILISSNQHSRRIAIIDYLFARIRKLGLEYWNEPPNYVADDCYGRAAMDFFISFGDPMRDLKKCCTNTLRPVIWHTSEYSKSFINQTQIISHSKTENTKIRNHCRYCNNAYCLHIGELHSRI